MTHAALEDGKLLEDAGGFEFDEFAAKIPAVDLRREEALVEPPDRREREGIRQQPEERGEMGRRIAGRAAGIRSTAEKVSREHAPGDRIPQDFVAQRIQSEGDDLGMVVDQLA